MAQVRSCSEDNEDLRILAVASSLEHVHRVFTQDMSQDSRLSPKEEK